MLAIEKDEIKDRTLVYSLWVNILNLWQISEITSTQKRNSLKKWSQNWKILHQNKKLQLWMKKLGCQIKDTARRKVSVILRINYFFLSSLDSV